MDRLHRPKQERPRPTVVRRSPLFQWTALRAKRRNTKRSHSVCQPQAQGATPGGSPKQRGVALIMVLVITTVLSAIATDLENDTKVNLRAAANARDQLQAHFHARSAIELELFILRLQGSIKGTLDQFIPLPLFELSGFLVSSDTIKGVLNRDSTPSDEPKVDPLEPDRPFGNFNGSFWIEEVVDENRKINLNHNFGIGCRNLMHPLLVAVIDDPKYDPLFESIGESRDPIRNRLDIIANITDWTDSDENIDPVCFVTGDAGTGGAEDARYDHLPYNVRYKPKNALMNSIAELRLVPGITDAFMRLFSKQLTVWGNKGVGLKTADPWMIRTVIRAISPGNLPVPEEKFKKYFEEDALRSALPPPLNKFSEEVFLAQLASAEIPYDQAKYTQLKPALRFDDISNVYRITAVGRVNDASSKITVVWLDTRAPTLSPDQFYYWREE